MPTPRWCSTCAANRALNEKSLASLKTKGMQVNEVSAAEQNRIRAKVASVYDKHKDSIGADAIKVVQGTIEVLDGAADGANANFVGALPQFPVVPDNLCPFGYYVVKVGASGAAARDRAAARPVAL